MLGCECLFFRLFFSFFIATRLLISSSANGANFQVMFYLPLYFQSVKGDSAIMSGVYTLPFVCFYTVGSMLSGAWIGKTRLPIIIEIASPLLALIGAVLFYEMDVNTSKAWYIGAQIPIGFGVGLGNQAPVTVLQAFAKPTEVAATVGIIFSKSALEQSLCKYLLTTSDSVPNHQRRLLQHGSAIPLREHHV
jgi:hypothetical protein